MVKVYKVSLEDQSLAEWERHWNEILENKIEDYSEALDVNELEEAGQTTIETLLQAGGFIRYINRTNRSNVKEYRIGETFVVIRFKDESTYLYSNSLLTEGELTYIKNLADSGAGLNSYLTRLIGRRYTARLYRDVVFIQPGLEAFDRTITVPTLTLETFSEAPIIAEKRYIKNLIEILQSNHELRLKRLTEALGCIPDDFNAAVPKQTLNDTDPAARILLYSNPIMHSNSLRLLDNFNESIISTLRNRLRYRLIESVSAALSHFINEPYKGGFTLDDNLDWVELSNYDVTKYKAPITTPSFDYHNRIIAQVKTSKELVERLINVLRKSMFEINEHNSTVMVADLKTLVTTIDDMNNYFTDLLIALTLGMKQKK